MVVTVEKMLITIQRIRITETRATTAAVAMATIEAVGVAETIVTGIASVTADGRAIVRATGARTDVLSARPNEDTDATTEIETTAVLRAVARLTGDVIEAAVSTATKTSYRCINARESCTTGIWLPKVWSP